MIGCFPKAALTYLNTFQHVQNHASHNKHFNLIEQYSRYLGTSGRLRTSALLYQRSAYSLQLLITAPHFFLVSLADYLEFASHYKPFIKENRYQQMAIEAYSKSASLPYARYVLTRSLASLRVAKPLHLTYTPLALFHMSTGILQKPTQLRSIDSNQNEVKTRDQCVVYPNTYRSQERSKNRCELCKSRAVSCLQRIINKQQQD